MLNGDEASDWQRQMQRKQQADFSDRTGAADKFWLNKFTGGGCRYQLRSPRLLTSALHLLGSLFILHSLTLISLIFPFFCYSFLGGSFFFLSPAPFAYLEMGLRHINRVKQKLFSHNTPYTIVSSSYNNTTTQPLHPPPPVFPSFPLSRSRRERERGQSHYLDHYWCIRLRPR